MNSLINALDRVSHAAPDCIMQLIGGAWVVYRSAKYSSAARWLGPSLVARPASNLVLPKLVSGNATNVLEALAPMPPTLHYDQPDQTQWTPDVTPFLVTLAMVCCLWTMDRFAGRGVRHLVRNPSTAVDLSVEALKYFAVLLFGIGFAIYGTGLAVLGAAWVLFWLVVYAGRYAPVFVDYAFDTIDVVVKRVRLAVRVVTTIVRIVWFLFRVARCLFKLALPLVRFTINVVWFLAALALKLVSEETWAPVLDARDAVRHAVFFPVKERADQIKSRASKAYNVMKPILSPIMFFIRVATILTIIVFHITVFLAPVVASVLRVVLPIVRVVLRFAIKVAARLLQMPLFSLPTAFFVGKFLWNQFAC